MWNVHVWNVHVWNVHVWMEWGLLYLFIVFERTHIMFAFMKLCINTKLNSCYFLMRLLDAFRVEAPPTSIALSPTGDFLCSTHVDNLAVYLWSNCTLYSHVSLRPLPSNHIPTISTDLPHTPSPGDEDLDKLEAEKLYPSALISPTPLHQEMKTSTNLRQKNYVQQTQKKT